MRMMKILISSLCLLFLSGCGTSARLVTDSADSTTNVRSGFMGNSIPDYSGEKAEGLVAKLIDDMSENNIQGICQLYAPSVRSEVDDLEEQIHKLCDQYDGDLISYDMVGPAVYFEKDKGEKTEEMQASFAVTTTSGTYYFAIQFYTVCTKNPADVGIHSIYLSKVGTENNFTFWGDHEWRHGVVFWDEEEH